MGPHHPSMAPEGPLSRVTVLWAKGHDDQKRSVDIRAVPYYGWANREPGAMTVWIHER